MHEVSLVEEVIRIAEEQLIVHQSKCIEEIVLEIGKLSGIEIDSFNFAWEACIPKTKLQHTKRVTIYTRGRAICAGCQTEQDIEAFYEPCNKCGLPLRELLQGNELKIKQLTLN